MDFYEDRLLQLLKELETSMVCKRNSDLSFLNLFWLSGKIAGKEGCLYGIIVLQ